jgi:hypothetical protein
MTKIAPEEAAYVAGLIDGEGCFQISTTLQPFMTIEMKGAAALFAELAATFGGSIYDQSRGGIRPRMAAWRIQGDDLVGFLPEVMPYLRVKQSQAARCHLLAEAKRELRHALGVGRIGRFPEGFKQWGLDLRAMVQDDNRRGLV